MEIPNATSEITKASCAMTPWVSSSSGTLACRFVGYKEETTGATLRRRMPEVTRRGRSAPCRGARVDGRQARGVACRPGGSRMEREWILLNPGPANTSRSVREALVMPDLCHREPEFFEMMRDCRERLVRMAGCAESFASVLFTGSGTAAVEAAVC